MCATGRGKTFGSTGSGRSGVWLLAALFLLGAFLQACTDQSGSKGPTPSSPSGGQAGGDLVVLALLVSPGPGSDQFTITLVAQSRNGAPLDGRVVFMSTTTGRLSRTEGLTDANGRFVSILLCNGAAMVSAFVEGVTTSTAAC